MNDRFKLKCFNKLQNKMYEVRSISYYQGNIKRIEVEDNGKILIFDDYENNIDNCILIQSTGLHDKNGKLIYEGDVIVIPNQYPFYDEGALNYIGIVENIYNSWQYVYHCVNPLKNGISEGINYLLNEFGFEENENSHFEVIGNKYENKELLND